MNDTSHPAVCVTRRIPFPAERVFDAWLDPALAAKWLYATPTGTMVVAEVDARVGGRYTFTERRNGEDVMHTGEYLEMVRPQRLVFTLGVPKYSPNFDRITVEIAPDGDGCFLTLTHVTTPEWAGPVRGGWVQILETLAARLGDKRAVTNREYGTHPAPGELRLVRLLPGPIERVWSYLTESDKRSTWLARGPLELRVGSPISWWFRHSEISPLETPPDKYKEYHETGTAMKGEVTRCEPPNVLSYLWEEVPEGTASEVTFALSSKGEDVELILTHRKLGADPKMLLSVSAGWHTHAAILIAILSGNTPPPFWSMHERLETEYCRRLESA